MRSSRSSSNLVRFLFLYAVAPKLVLLWMLKRWVVIARCHFAGSTVTLRIAGNGVASQLFCNYVSFFKCTVEKFVKSSRISIWLKFGVITRTELDCHSNELHFLFITTNRFNRIKLEWGARWSSGQCASACDRGSYATLVSHWMGDQKFIISRSSVLRKAR
jgi:hypothetical protein